MSDFSEIAAAIEALPPLREVIARHHLRARGALGQHFLTDLNLTDRIARAAGPLEDALVFEVGPGPGALTRSLLCAGAAHVIAVERDARCVEALQELVGAAEGRLTVIEGDALETDPAALSAAHGGVPIRIVANLPYNIGTALLTKWLGQARAFASLTLMFQKEVAERLIANPGSKAYGRLSVVTQWLCDVERLFNLPAEAFVPPPKVASSVVQLTPRAEPLAPAEMADLERVTAAAFGQRRKMVRSSLKSLGSDVGAMLAVAGVEPTARAEDLPVDAFCALARALTTGPAA
ncbi:MAG: 16S rRNA (adenine(1518)-N(6)/adenine(1519)-N(6))-dimethyltransferase RsmA [Alphaproteobacteria bacterium]